jgi:flagellar protein FlgJ
MTAVSPVASTAAPATDRAQLKQAAQQFEAILLRQVLAEARKADFGETPFSDGASGGGGLGTFREMMDSRFADVAAGTGALGLGKLIEAQLARLLPSETKA